MFKIESQMMFLALILLGTSKGTTACSDHACVSSGVGAAANGGLQVHNAYRQQHSIQPLELCSEKLAASASKCAQYYCLGSPSGPNCPYKPSEVGENSLILYFSDSTVGPEELTGIASDTWHAVSGTDADLLRAFTSANGLKDIQSFSQMMWSSATRVGFAVCTCEDGRKSIVAHYNVVQSLTGQVESCTESSGTAKYSTTGSYR